MNNKEIHYKIITYPNYKFNDTYGLIYLSCSDFNIIIESLSYLRKIKEIDGNTYHILFDILKHYNKNLFKIKELDDSQPRFIAQKFIGKKNIREFIFKRDKYKCLKCEKETDLTIDHINPIKLKGVNKISNLQTLCRSCNSSKSDKFKDYRNGSR